MRLASSLTAVIFSIAYLALLIGASPIQPPSTTPTCNPGLEDQNIADPSNCAQYFRCVYGRSVPKQCPERMLFNPSIGNCDLYYNVDCPSTDSRNVEDEDLTETIESLALAQQPKKNALSTEEDQTTFDGRRGETTTLQFVYQPHERYNNAYYQIENGEKLLMFCEEGMVFSFDLEICAKAWGV